jgi:hypothetical protein
MLWEDNGILNTLAALTAKNLSTVQAFLNIMENHIVKLTTINKLDLYAQAVENQLLEDVLTLLERYSFFC